MERTRRRARPALLASAAAAATVLAAATPAGAAPDRVVYDALGDSYAAGFGVQPGEAYPYVLDGRMGIALDDLAAVPGATVRSMLATQLGVLDADTGLVTLSIGGNDIPWTAVVIACGIGSDAQCAGAVATTRTAIQEQLPGALDLAYTQVRGAAPHAHVVVTGYPRLFSPEAGDYTGVVPRLGLPFDVSVAEQQAMNQLADLLDATIADRAAAHGVQFVDVTERFTGHGVNAAEPWIGGIEDPEQLHPTVKGQHTYGVALRAAIRPADLR